MSTSCTRAQDCPGTKLRLSICPPTSSLSTSLCLSLYLPIPLCLAVFLHESADGRTYTETFLCVEISLYTRNWADQERERREAAQTKSLTETTRAEAKEEKRGSREKEKRLRRQQMMARKTSESAGELHAVAHPVYIHLPHSAESFILCLRTPSLSSTDC